MCVIVGEFGVRGFRCMGLFYFIGRGEVGVVVGGVGVGIRVVVLVVFVMLEVEVVIFGVYFFKEILVLSVVDVEEVVEV